MPLRDTKRIVMGHGGGGILSEELIENLFLPAFGSSGGPSRDSAVMDTGAGRIALTMSELSLYLEGCRLVERVKLSPEAYVPGPLASGRKRVVA